MVLVGQRWMDGVGTGTSTLGAPLHDDAVVAMFGLSNGRVEVQ